MGRKDGCNWTPGLSLRAVNCSTCYGRVCLIGETRQQSIKFSTSGRKRQEVTKNLMTACTKTRNTGTAEKPRNTEFDSVVLFSNYRP